MTYSAPSRQSSLMKSNSLEIRGARRTNIRPPASAAAPLAA
jgi:hypothetical protein